MTAAGGGLRGVLNPPLWNETFVGRLPFTGGLLKLVLSLSGRAHPLGAWRDGWQKTKYFRPRSGQRETPAAASTSSVSAPDALGGRP